MKSDKLNFSPDVDCETPPAICPGCDRTLDRATGAQAPHPGAISMCVYCGDLAAYADDLSLRPLNDEEILDIAGDSVLIRMQRALAEIRKRKAEP